MAQDEAAGPSDIDPAGDPRLARPLRGADGRRTRWVHLEHHAVVDSTQDVALAARRAGMPAGLVVVADAQRTGRGRRGRSWRDAVVGPVGPANLAVTVSVDVPTRAAELTPFVAGLAVQSAYERAGARPELKWPNDVLLEGRKAAGILVERHRVTTDTGAADTLLIGCGLNLDWRGVVREGEAAGWTSLAEVLDHDVDRVTVLCGLLDDLDRGLDELERGPEVILARYRERCTTIGRDVEVSLPDARVLRGRATAVDARGRLVVADASGEQAVFAGDVVHVRPSG